MATKTENLKEMANEIANKWNAEKCDKTIIALVPENVDDNNALIDARRTKKLIISLIGSICIVDLDDSGFISCDRKFTDKEKKEIIREVECNSLGWIIFFIECNKQIECNNNTIVSR